MDDPTKIYTELKDIQKKYMIRQFPITLTEKTLAETFADFFGINIRYDYKRQRFLVWNNNLWEEDRDGKIVRYIMRLSEIIQKEGEENDNKSLRDWGIKMQTHAKFNNIKNLIKAVKPIPLTGDGFDTQPFSLGVKNGIVDLSTGSLRSGRQDDYISMFAPVEFDPVATAPLWESFMQTVFEEDEELINYIQRALGYSMTASMKEQLVFICYGEGSNGKSIFFNVINKILGDYAHTCSSNTFKKNDYNTQTNDLADMERKRFLTNSESIKDQKMDEERIKLISGGDRITARRLHENNFSFYPICKIWLYTNNYPRFNDDSYGLWRRIRVIKFPHTFRGSERIDDLDKALLEEAPGILNWLIKGCLEWQQKGLRDMPSSITNATEEYRAENNPLAEYLADRTFPDKDEKIQSSLLYTDYKLWMADRRRPPMSLTAFGRKMNELPFEKKIEESGTYYYGIKIISS